jgi:DNA-binding response OmpR family regulator
MHHILIIEDEDSLRETLTDLLTFEGMRVSAAPNGEEGLRLIQEQPPDLILCDIMMPGIDGYGVLRKLQLSERTALIPFIFLTAKADAQQVREGMELGADDYLCKPITKAELLAAIRTRLWKQGQQRERIEHEVEAARQDVVRKLPVELLSPLTGLLSASQLLETADRNLPVAAIRELGRVTRLTSQRLHRMIRRFLLYAELQAACHQPEVQATLRGTTHIPATSLVSALAEHIARQYSRSTDLCLDL